MRPPVVVRVDTADPASLDRLLGTARQKVLGSRGSVLALDVGPATLERRAQSILFLWMERNVVVLRNQLEALVLVAPTWTNALLLRLVLRGKPPPVPYKVVRRLEDGLRWASAQAAAHAITRRR